MRSDLDRRLTEASFTGSSSDRRRAQSHESNDQPIKKTIGALRILDG